MSSNNNSRTSVRGDAYGTARLTVETTKATKHILEVEYHKSTSSPFIVADKVRREGFSIANLGEETVLYGPGAVYSVTIEREGADPGR